MKAPRAFLAALLALPLFAVLTAQPLGELTTIKGRVTIQSGSDAAKPAAVKQPVKEGDYLTTQSDGEAVITLSTGTVLKVGPDTRMKLNRNAVKTGDGNNFSVGLTKGSLSAKVSKLKTASDSFNVYTPTSVAGVRGTDFSVAAGVDGSAQVQVSEGEVEYGRGQNKASVKSKQRAETSLAEAPVKSEGSSEDLSKWLANKDKKAKANPEKTLADMQGYIDRSSQEATKTATTVSASESSKGEIKDKEQLQSEIKQAQGINNELQFNRTVAEGIMDNAKVVAGASSSEKAKELLSGVERIAKAFDDANARIEAALARLDARLAAARKRIDDSWKGAGDRIDRSMKGGSRVDNLFDKKK